MSESILQRADALLSELRSSRDALLDFDGMGLPELAEIDDTHDDIADEAIVSEESIDATWIDAERLIGQMSGSFDDARKLAGPLITIMNASLQMNLEAEVAPVRRILRFMAENGEHSEVNEGLWSAADISRAERRVLADADPRTHLSLSGMENVARAIGLRALANEHLTSADIESLITRRTVPLPYSRDCLNDLRDALTGEYGGVGLKAAGRKLAMALKYILSNHLIDEERVAIEGQNVIRYWTPGSSGILLLRTLIALLPAVVGACTIGRVIPMLGTPNVALIAEATTDLIEKSATGKPGRAVDAKMIPLLSSFISNSANFMTAIKAVRDRWWENSNALPSQYSELASLALTDGYLTSGSSAKHAKRTERWARNALAELEARSIIEPLVNRSRFRIYVAVGLPALVERYQLW